MSSIETLIVIPARYNSSRLPGKPLVKLAGKSMLQHVCTAALAASNNRPKVGVLVATDDSRILEHAQNIGVDAVMTPSDCPSGTDRIITAIAQLPSKPQSVINLQGDAPLTPPAIITALIQALNQATEPLVVTPVLQLSWQQLDGLRATKLTQPFSGTTVVLKPNSEAIWFSKQIIPAIRGEQELRNSQLLSPVFQHLGIYGYTIQMLDVIQNLAPSHYEKLEGLEQLRFIENGYPIRTVALELENLDAWRGVDTAEDMAFAEQLLLKREI